MRYNIHTCTYSFTLYLMQLNILATVHVIKINLAKRWNITGT